MHVRVAQLGALLLLVHTVTCGQSSDSSHIVAGRLAIVGGVTAVTVGAVHIYQQQAWWQGARAPFRFQNDWDYALNIDKFGHAYGAYFLSHLYTYALRWSGVRDQAAIFCGSMFGLGYQLYVEIEDGFHRDYGFSPGDAMADVAGAMLPLAQTTFPVLRNLGLKWSYFPSQEYKNALDHGQQRVFIDDYQGQIYWVAMDPHFVMSDKMSRAVPGWLGIAFGAGARDLSDPEHRRLLYFLSVDYNLSRIETGSAFLHSVFILVDHIHLPAPAVYLDEKRWKVGIVY